MPAIFNPDDVGRCGASTLRRPSVYACVEGVGHETQSENKRSVVDPVFCIFLCLDEYIRVPGRGDPVFPEGAVPEWSGAADCRKQHGGFQADIVCAAVSTAVQFAECTIADVLGNRVKTKVNEEKARITLTLPAQCEDEDAVQAVLTGMMLTLMHWREQYPDYLEVVMEV